MAEKSGIGLWAFMIAAPIICCGGPSLIAAGVLSGFGAWLIGGGWAWIAAAAAFVLFAALLIYRRRTAADAGHGANTLGGDSDRRSS